MEESDDERCDPQEDFVACCRYGDEDEALQLLRAHPDIDVAVADDFGTTPLHAACANGLVVLAGDLIRRLAPRLNAVTIGGNTALHYAAMNRHREIIEMLLAAGADSRIKNQQGQTPFYEAVMRMGGEEDAAKVIDALAGPDESIRLQSDGGTKCIEAGDEVAVEVWS